MAWIKLGRIARFIGHSLLVLFAIATLGCLVPALPGIGSVGPLLMSSYGPWLTILSLIGAGLVFRRWLHSRKSRTLVLVTLAAFAVIGTLYIQARQIGVAKASGFFQDHSSNPF